MSKDSSVPEDITDPKQEDLILVEVDGGGPFMSPVRNEKHEVVSPATKPSSLVAFVSFQVMLEAVEKSCEDSVEEV